MTDNSLFDGPDVLIDVPERPLVVIVFDRELVPGTQAWKDEPPKPPDNPLFSMDDPCEWG